MRYTNSNGIITEVTETGAVFVVLNEAEAKLSRERYAKNHPPRVVRLKKTFEEVSNRMEEERVKVMLSSDTTWRDSERYRKLSKFREKLYV